MNIFKSAGIRFLRVLITTLIAPLVSNQINVLVDSPVLKLSLTGAAIMAIGKAIREWGKGTKVEKITNYLPF